MSDITSVLKGKMTESDFSKLDSIGNAYLNEFVAKYVSIMNPDKVIVCTGTQDDLEMIRNDALSAGEEIALKTEGHTLHFEGYKDQARDKNNTKILVSGDLDLGDVINTSEREESLREIEPLMKDIMVGTQMYVLFYCLGPNNSAFSIPAVQLTDSSYVAHSENLLYRQGYDEIKKIGNSNEFFKFVHSEGELDGAVCKNVHNRRVYIDLDSETVFSLNTQYGGNTIGLKKLAMRFAIRKGAREGWLCEHMFIMGINGPDNRVTYFTGAYPSLCGKTSTSMLKGERIVGDDISYLRAIDGELRAVNVEKGIFGIIPGVNSKDDPIIWKTLNSPGDIIFSNVLKTEDGGVYWTGKDGDVPEKGFNHSGEWYKGKKDESGKEIPPSHPNARFTLSMDILENLDPIIEDPKGCLIKGIIYGGRDSDTCPPVEQSFDWDHGVITKGAGLESESTAATLGSVGVRDFNPMSNIDFLSIPIGSYIKAHLDFGRKLSEKPVIFGVNYFLSDKEGNFLNDKTDKAVWMKWMELRCNGDVKALKSPTGMIPLYEDLHKLFVEVLNKDYSKEDYVNQFSARIPEGLSKIDRIEKIYKEKVADTPEELFDVLSLQRERLLAAKKEFGDLMHPDKMEMVD